MAVLWHAFETLFNCQILAEEEGFEPPVGFPLRRFSRPLPSTTRPLLQYRRRQPREYRDASPAVKPQPRHLGRGMTPVVQPAAGQLPESTPPGLMARFLLYGAVMNRIAPLILTLGLASCAAEGGLEQADFEPADVGDDLSDGPLAMGATVDVDVSIDTPGSGTPAWSFPPLTARSCRSPATS